MKNKRKILLIVLLCLGLGILCFNLAYSDSGWDSNYNSGGYAGGSSYDSGGYGSYSGGGGGFSTGNVYYDIIISFVLLIVIFISCIVAIIKFKQSERYKKLIQKKYKALEQITSDDLEESKKIDELRDKAINTYKLFVENIDNKNELLKLCSQKVLDTLKFDNLNKEHFIENLNILEFNITNIDEDNHLITCYLTASCNDYYYNKKTKKYSGYKDKLKYFDAMIIFKDVDNKLIIDDISEC